MSDHRKRFRVSLVHLLQNITIDQALEAPAKVSVKLRAWDIAAVDCASRGAHMVIERPAKAQPLVRELAVHGVYGKIVRRQDPVILKACPHLNDVEMFDGFEVDIWKDLKHSDAYMRPRKQALKTVMGWADFKTHNRPRCRAIVILLGVIEYLFELDPPFQPAPDADHDLIGLLREVKRKAEAGSAADVG